MSKKSNIARFKKAVNKCKKKSVIFKSNINDRIIRMPVANMREAKSYAKKLKRENSQYKKNAVLPSNRNFTLYKNIKIKSRC